MSNAPAGNRRRVGSSDFVANHPTFKSYATFDAEIEFLSTEEESVRYLPS